MKLYAALVYLQQDYQCKLCMSQSAVTSSLKVLLPKAQYHIRHTALSTVLFSGPGSKPERNVLNPSYSYTKSLLYKSLLQKWKGHENWRKGCWGETSLLSLITWKEDAARKVFSFLRRRVIGCEAMISSCTSARGEAAPAQSRTGQSFPLMG